jgi:hypothetical protein
MREKNGTDGDYRTIRYIRKLRFVRLPVFAIGFGKSVRSSGWRKSSLLLRCPNSLHAGSCSRQSGGQPVDVGSRNRRIGCRDRLLTQIQQILEINALDQVTKAAVEAARESLVIGQV